MVLKTTLNLDDGLLREAKKLAAERGATLTSVIEEAVRALLKDTKAAKPYVFRWPVVRGRGGPLVDVADRDALYERMEGRF